MRASYRFSRGALSAAIDVSNATLMMDESGDRFVIELEKTGEATVRFRLELTAAELRALRDSASNALNSPNALRATIPTPPTRH